MKYRITLFDLMIIVILFCSNLMFLNINITNTILSVTIFCVSVLFFLKNDININYNYLLISYISIFLIIITGQLNLISSVIIIILFILVKYDNSNISLHLYIRYSVCFFCIIVFSYFVFGFNSSNDTTIWRAYTGETYSRMSLGYYHSNTAMLMWLTIVIAMIKKTAKKNILRILIFIAIITYFLYSLTLSRTSTIIIAGYCLSIFIFRNRLDNLISKKYKKILAIAPFYLMIVSLLLVKLTDVTWINNLLSGRLAIYSNAWNKYGLTLFGNTEIESLMFDNAYLHMLMAKGIIFSIIFIIIFYLIVRGSKGLTVKDTILITGFLIAGVMETILLKFEFIVLILIILYQNDNKVLKENIIKERRTL